MSGNSKSREDLSREAYQVRSQLVRTVDELDDRRHGALDFRMRLKRHLRNLAVAGGLLLVATAAAVAVVASRVATAPDRRRRNRWRLAKRLWRHPEKAMRAERRSFFGEVGRSLLLAIASTAVTVPARRWAAKLVGGKAEGKKPRASAPDAR